MCIRDRGYIEKMRRLGIETTAEDYLTSADAAEHTLLTEFPGQQCYVSGTASLKAQLTGAGIQVSDTLSDDITVLLSGFDPELTFQKLEASCILLNRGVTWLATRCVEETAAGPCSACFRSWMIPPHIKWSLPPSYHRTAAFAMGGLTMGRGRSIISLYPIG